MTSQFGVYNKEGYKSLPDMEMKMDQIFNSYDYDDEDKVLIAKLEFEGYAMDWQN